MSRRHPDRRGQATELLQLSEMHKDPTVRGAGHMLHLSWGTGPHAPSSGLLPPTTPAKCWLWGSRRSPKCSSPAGTAPSDFRDWQLGAGPCQSGPTVWGEGRRGPLSGTLCAAPAGFSALLSRPLGTSGPQEGDAVHQSLAFPGSLTQALARLRPPPAPHWARDQGVLPVDRGHLVLCQQGLHLRWRHSALPTVQGRQTLL